MISSATDGEDVGVGGAGVDVGSGRVGLGLVLVVGVVGPLVESNSAKCFHSGKKARKFVSLHG